MERFGNASHDDIQNLMDMSKNKNTTKAARTWMNMYLRAGVFEKEIVEPKKLDEITFFYGTEKARGASL